LNEHSAGVVVGPDPKIVTKIVPPGAMVHTPIVHW
jgi:hypothetical protein